MTLVYILNTYDEYGPEEIRTTTDPKKMISILDTLLEAERVGLEEKTWKEGYYEERQQYLNDCRTNLVKFIAKSMIGTEDLSRGWGGYQIHAAELE